ncbi:MAG: cell division protein FtsZ [Succinivibrionaceae bacterium]|nr:cell division protein FtsZ [Succinivibrionaceae bacterium]
MSDFRLESVSAPSSDVGIQPSSNCVIRVLGVGGGGGNSLQHMINESLSGVEFIAVNTDSQALTKSTSPLKVQIGVKLTNGLGAGCDPNKGRKAAEESKDDIRKLLEGSDMVFITAGMGGGTGTGAAPIIAEIAKETGALTVAVVTKPFLFEGKRHMINAESGITELSKHVDSLIVIDNQKLLKNLGANISIVNAFNEANDVLLNAVKGITDSITQPGFINLDFADVQTVMRGRGHAMIGTGLGKGANFVQDAVDRAIHSPLIEQSEIASAAGLLVNARVNPNFPITKWQEICTAVQNYADDEADCKFGILFDDKVGEDEIAITILITGISGADLTTGSQSRAGNGGNIRRSPFVQEMNAGTSDRGFFANDRMSAPQGAVQQFATPQPQPVQQVGNAFAAPQAAPFGRSEVPAAEIPVGQDSSSSDEGSLWELPPILRNKAD